MKGRRLLSLLALLLAPAISAPGLGILPVAGDTPESDRILLGDSLVDAFVKTGRFKVLDRSRLGQVLAAQALQETGVTEAAQAVKVGRLANARLILLSRLSRLDIQLVLTSQLVDVESGVVIGTGKAEGLLAREILGQIPALCNEVSAAVAGISNETLPPPAVSNEEGATGYDFSGSRSRPVSVDSPPSGQTTGWFPFQLSFLDPAQIVPSWWSVRGLALAMIYQRNVDVWGLSAGTLVNSTGTMIGVQAGVASFANLGYGLQAGVLSSAQGFTGAQIGVVNVATRLVGVQIGLVNVTRQLVGVQLGLVNFVLDRKTFGFLPILNLGF